MSNCIPPQPPRLNLCSLITHSLPWACSFLFPARTPILSHDLPSSCHPRAFELAALPGTSDKERRRLLHFVVVGGGPTGVEFAGTLSDYVRSDLKRKYPSLMPFVRVSLLQSAQSILTQFDSKLAARALEDLRRSGVEIRTGVRVVQVTDKQVVLKGGEREDYGVCVWSCGNAALPLVQSLVDAIPEQVRGEGWKGTIRGFSGWHRSCLHGGAQVKALEISRRRLPAVAPAGSPRLIARCNEHRMRRVQAPLQKGGPSSAKLVVDPFLRVIGAVDVIALGDCSSVVDGPLPATAQVLP